MDKVSAIFSESNREKILLKDLQLSQEIKKNWHSMVGAVLYKQLFFCFLRRGVIVLEVFNPCWYSEIKLYEKEIMQKVGTFTGKKIKGIKILLKKKSS